MSLTVVSTVGVLDRGGLPVATVRDLTGGISSAGKRRLRVALTGRLVGRPSYWCAEGAELRLTFLTHPKRRRSARLTTTVTVERIDGERIALVGTASLSTDDTYPGPIPTVRELESNA